MGCTAVERREPIEEKEWSPGWFYWVAGTAFVLAGPALLLAIHVVPKLLKME